MNRLVIIGASGHGRVIADIAKKNNYKEIVFLDDNKLLKTCGNYPIMGSSKDIFKFSESDFIVGIGNAIVREKLQLEIENQKLSLATLIHPNAVIAEDAVIGDGTVVMAGAVVNSGTTIGRGCIINTCSSVDHDCRLDDFVHVSVGSHIAGTVTIGRQSWIGIGAIVSNNIDILENCIVGAGAVVVSNIPSGQTVVGVPARSIQNN